LATGNLNDLLVYTALLDPPSFLADASEGERLLLFQHNEGKNHLQSAAGRRKTTLPTSN
jgi:hypothetical protein